MWQSGSLARFFLRFWRYYRSKHRAWTQATADGSHSTGKKRVVLHSYGDGKQANEGVVVGMVSGSANAQVGRLLDVIFYDVR